MKLKIGKVRRDSQLTPITAAPPKPDPPVPEPPKPVDFTATEHGKELVNTLEAIIVAIQGELSRPRRGKAPKARC